MVRLGRNDRFLRVVISSEHTALLTPVDQGQAIEGGSETVLK